MSYCRALIPVFAGGVTSLLLVGTAAATLTGQAGEGLYYFPDTSTPYLSQTFASLDTFVIGPGEEEAVTIEGVVTFHIDFGADDLSMLINTVARSSTFHDTPFNGLIFTSDAFLGLGGASVDPTTTLAYFDDSHVTLDGDQLRLNFAGLDYGDGDQLKLDFTGKAGRRDPREPRDLGDDAAGLWRRRIGAPPAAHAAGNPRTPSGVESLGWRIDMRVVASIVRRTCRPLALGAFVLLQACATGHYSHIAESDAGQRADEAERDKILSEGGASSDMLMIGGNALLPGARGVTGLEASATGGASGASSLLAPTVAGGGVSLLALGGATRGGPVDRVGRRRLRCRAVRRRVRDDGRRRRGGAQRRRQALPPAVGGVTALGHGLLGLCWSTWPRSRRRGRPV